MSERSADAGNRVSVSVALSLALLPSSAAVYTLAMLTSMPVAAASTSHIKV